MRGMGRALFAFVVVAVAAWGTTVPPAGADVVDDRCYVELAYPVFLDRPATEAEVQRWLTAFAGGQDRSGLPAQLAASDEWLGVVVDGIYQAALDRDADAGGRAFWVGQLRRGVSVNRVGAQVFGSTEFLDRNGGTLPGFVDALYSRILGRAPSQLDRDFWVGEAERRGRPKVAEGFYASVESRGQRVDSLFTQVLGRAADAGGRSFWVGQLARVNDVRLAVQLASSAEFRIRASRQCGPGTISRVVAGNGDTWALGASADGQTILLVTEATNVGTGGAGLYLRAPNGMLTRLGDGADARAAISPSGRYVVYRSASGTVKRLDRQAGTTGNVVNDTTGGSTFDIDVADDGTVAFVTTSRLVPADTTNDADLYVWRGGTYARVPIPSTLEPFAPSISGDGRWVAFQGEEGASADIYAYSVIGGGVTRLTTGDEVSEYPSISYDGRWVAFDSDSTNLVPGGVAGIHVYRVERDTKAVSVVARATPFSLNATISADGQSVAFLSRAFGAGAHLQVFRWSAATGVVTKLTAGDAAALLTDPIISGDGASVVFSSPATNLVAGDSNGHADIFRWSV